ncbi:hypothetical protein JYP46_21875 [Nitratireductor aquimarinus]|nr:hypothetical protein [Nitratireductor aquimarinus]MBY6024053.1 hypothetical protein [Nitratireductor sp. DP7N14-4]
MAAQEAFRMLNAATRNEYRGWGDTQTAARDRAARKAGITPAQAERVWKHWREMKSMNADVYRGLRNAYGHLCALIENTADRIEREAQAIEESNAAMSRDQAALGSNPASPQSKEREEA